MFDLVPSNLESLVIHVVGNKLRQEGVGLSEGLTAHDDEGMKELLYRYLLRPFESRDNYYRFRHSTNVKLNELYNYVSNVFQNRESFYEQSVNVARHLYEQSTHPRIRGGEFFMVYISGCKYEDRQTDAIGIFKTENKETYLKVVANSNTFNLDYDRGININKLDKGCLIFNVDDDSGYRMLVVDVHNKASEEARYWRDQFLQVEPVPSETFVTEQYMNLVNQFVQKPIPEADKRLTMELRTRAVEFFANSDAFELERFSSDVLQDDPALVEGFRSVCSQYVQQESISLPEHFNISPDVVRTQKRKFKNQIRLDGAITISLPSDNPDILSQVERGFDSKTGMHYYKVYFRDED